MASKVEKSTFRILSIHLEPCVSFEIVSVSNFDELSMSCWKLERAMPTKVLALHSPSIPHVCVHMRALLATKLNCVAIFHATECEYVAMECDSVAKILPQNRKETHWQENYHIIELSLPQY